MGDIDQKPDTAEQLNRETSGGRQPGRGSFNFRKLLIGTIACCAVLALLVPLVRHLQQLSQRVSQRTECRHNLEWLGYALHNYADTYGSFPRPITYADDGTPLHSWRVRVLPFVMAGPVHEAYDYQEAWNGPNNKLLGDETPDVWDGKYGTYLFDAEYFAYRCPSAPPTQNHMCTNYVMLIDDRPGKPNGPPNLPGSVPPTRDPPSKVIIIEIADSDIHWMEPRDVLLSKLSLKINDRSKTSISSYHGGACVLQADGSVLVLDESTTAEHLKQLLTP